MVAGHAVAFNAEADSLNCSILGPNAAAGSVARSCLRCCCAVTTLRPVRRRCGGIRPVSTIIPYRDVGEAITLAARGDGSLVGAGQPARSSPDRPFWYCRGICSTGFVQPGEELMKVRLVPRCPCSTRAESSYTYGYDGG